MTGIETFLEKHHHTLITCAPDDAGQRLRLPHEWAIKVPFHAFEDDSVLSLIVYLTEGPKGTFTLDYRLSHDTISGEELRSTPLVMGEFAELRNDLMREMLNIGQDQALADKPAAHRMFRYVETLYQELANDVTFKARYEPQKAD